MQMHRAFVFTAALALTSAACSEGPVSPDPDFQAQYSTVEGGVLHSVTGSAHFRVSGALRTFTASAVEHADGTVSGRGQLNARVLGLRAQGTVDCMVVIDNFAALSGIVTNSNDPAEVGRGVVWAVRDNGEGRNAPADEVTFLYRFDPHPDLCKTWAPVLMTILVPAEKGNVKVR
jgi:hypothetical protein